jgi:two-component system sensor histidine kinase PilS (NtrC family)
MSAPHSVAPWTDVTASLPGDSAFLRLWLGFATARVAIAVVLLALLSTLLVLGLQQINAWQLGLCGAYAAAALAVRIFIRPMPPGHAFDPQWVFTIGVDLVAFSMLEFLQTGGINYAPLFALPVLMASVLGSSLLALGTAAGVTLLLLTEAWLVSLQLPGDAPARFLQAGLTGTGYFAVAVLANQLATRLAGEEKTARRSQMAARMQAQVNELVIDTLADGVLVVNAQGDVHAANPAARVLLGCGDAAWERSFRLASQPAWAPLVECARQAFALRSAQHGEIAIQETGMQPRRIFVRTRLTAPHDNQGDSLCVIFLEDLREMEARLRTDKLAAMGRMSAAVAHEIRNPLAAITQANALLDEDLHDPAQKQLSGLVAQNARRLAQIVEEVLDIARVQSQQAQALPAMLELDACIDGACRDWARQTGSAQRLQVALGTGGERVHFEADHLRRVLVNLLDNALRYAGERPDSIQVSSARGGATAAGRSTLSVWSDGAPLEQTVERHLFEPFFSSESRSSGLGLYISRELCERYGAQIGYRRTSGPGGAGREGNEFYISFAPPAAALAAARPFDTMAA